MKILAHPITIVVPVCALLLTGCLPPPAPMHVVPATAAVTLRDFKLVGDLTNDSATFILTATARVDDARGGTLDVLAGPVALTALDTNSKVQMRLVDGRYVLAFDHRGEFPVRVQFSAAVGRLEGWKRVDFRVAPGVLESLALRGLAADTQFRFPGGARPDLQGDSFLSYLPEDGAVKIAWKEARPETEGKLFFSTEMLAQISVGPGLMRQTAILHFKVMQGELNRVALRLKGAGEITRVQGEQVLSWALEPVAGSTDRRLVIQLNQPQKDQFGFLVQAQTPLGAFPQTADALRLSPEEATGFSGYLRIVNDGAVRLEVTQAGGTSQISPEQFPESDTTRAAFRGGGNERFAYRFAGGDYALRIQADQILPELTATEVLAYHYGESELAIDAEIELDIRQAPLRELVLHVPKGYAVAQLAAASMSDYFLTQPEDAPDSELRLVFGQPLSGRELVQLRLEHNMGLDETNRARREIHHASPTPGETNWPLPRIDIAKATSVRGSLGIAADPGFRLTAERTQGLTEIAPAFYPGKLPGIQTAFRLTEPAWAAAVRVERLPQTVQADVLHLFSIGEGIAYGSSVINYVISGAPVASFKVELSDDYENVEFTGKDIRNRQKVSGGYVVQLHTPVSGAYTLLATYERPFKAEGATLAFTGARPLDAQSEQGYTLVTSAYQFQVRPADVSPTLLPVEPGEVPPEYRLFTDAPVLAAYRYAARPFNLTLTLSPLAQGDSLNQIVDRASLETHISKEGQAVTSVRYFIKNRGNPRFRLTLPAGSQLWSATVNGTEAVPVSDGAASLIPLPQSADPNAVLELDLTLASLSPDARLVRVEAPVSDAPVMLAEWRLEPDTGQRLVYQDGSVMPAGGVQDVSGFAQLARLFSGKGWRASALQAPKDVTLLAPVQQAGRTLSVAVLNLEDKTTAMTVLGWIWPAFAGLALWVIGWALGGARLEAASWVVGWTLLAWAALRIPNGAMIFFLVLLAFLLWHAGGMALRRMRRIKASPGTAAATALLALGFVGFGDARAAEPAALPDSVTQNIRVEKQFVFGDAKIHWQAVQGQSLALLGTNAVLTGVKYPKEVLDLVASPTAEQLVARKSGAYDIELHYQTRVNTNDAESGFLLPTPCGLVMRLGVTVVNLDVDVESPQAVSTQSDAAGSNTVATLVLTPKPAWIGWRPRRRDAAKEKPVYYADVTQLFVPSAGVIEGAHYATIRPAQGEVSELLLHLPPGETVTDVSDPANPGSLVSLWRFDPDTRQLRVTLNPPQSRPFVVLVRSQAATGPLPLDQSVGLLSVANAAGQIGSAGIATGGEVQLDEVSAPEFSPINLEDFPADPVAALQGEFPGLTLRRAFRYSDSNTNAVLGLKASAVQPDVRVETEDTLSLGEDRTVLADNFTATITRAGVFDLSFVMPAGFEEESISGAALSQWTESKTDQGRVITLHLLGKTLGAQAFAVTLSGAGIKTAHGWKAPQIVVREANKQHGTLLIVPEQGMRLQIGEREGYTQLDPQKSGIRQKGVLAFRALQVPALLTLDVEQVDPWIQVDGWQHADVSEAQVKVTANLLYQIENTGLKSLRILIPTNAEGVRFEGDQVGDFLADTNAPVAGMKTWEVKLRRRVIGSYLLQAAYETALPAQARGTVLRGIKAADANQQRGFVTVQSDPRLEVAADPAPPSLQPAEWQSIPRALQKDQPASAATLTYRAEEPAFELPLKLTRHTAARLLPARVNNITFNSVVSDDGVMLTRARLEILPGDKRLLEVTLPAEARFWFAFVNENGVWPWRNSTNVLIPLGPQASDGKAATVELYYGCRTGTAAAHELDLDLAAPKFDLPLENITWRISLSDKWHVKHYEGALQFQEEEAAPPTDGADEQTYLAGEKSLRKARTQEAQAYLALGNSSLEKGDPQQARRAFQAAYGLSTDDAAFNEDARVELHNIKLQEALIGFNARQSQAAGDTGAVGGKLRELRNRQDLNYTQQDAKDIIDINSADDNAAFLRLAEKLIQQQDAAVSSPAAIRANIPQQGQWITFHRAVAVDPWADLNIKLQASMTRTAPLAVRLLTLGVICGIFAVLTPALSRRKPAS